METVGDLRSHLGPVGACLMDGSGLGLSTPLRALRRRWTPLGAAMVAVADGVGANEGMVAILDHALGTTVLVGARMTGVYMVFGNLVAAVMPAADLRDADMRYADLSGANMRNADLRGAWMCGATVVGVDFHGALRLPRDEQIPGWYLINGRLKRSDDEG